MIDEGLLKMILSSSRNTDSGSVARFNVGGK